MRILITGATGFLGYQITRACIDAGHEVLCLRRASSQNPFDAEYSTHISWFEISDVGVVQNFAPEVLIHAAWLGLDHENRNNPEVQQSNVALMQEVLSLYEYKQIVVLGSMEEYGYPGVLMTEELPLKPFSAYTEAKIDCLRYLQDYVDRRTVEWQWIRVCTVYGEHQQAAWLIPTLISNCLKGEPIIETTKGEQEYGFLFGEDFGRAIASVVGVNGKSGVYNVSAHSSIHLYELFDLVKELTGYQGVFSKSLPYRGNGNLMILADSTKFREAFGEFEATPLRDGLLKLIGGCR